LAFIPPAIAERFVDCHDGDTCTLEDGQRVRLSGIDAPELGQPCSEASRNYLIRLVVNQEATLDYNGRSYGRRVCNVSVLGMDVQKALVSQGLAFDYTQSSKGLYAMDETVARTSHRGVWQLPGGGGTIGTVNGPVATPRRKLYASALNASIFTDHSCIVLGLLCLMADSGAQSAIEC